jgi:hypothetical protein
MPERRVGSGHGRDRRRREHRRCSGFPQQLAGLIAGLVVAATASAAELTATARAEIAALLDRLGGSGCEFYRNGSWYDAARAREHLETKYRYLDRDDELASAEDFIARAGSVSSMSGRPYQVRCGDTTVDSGDWLRAELLRLRARQPEETGR